ncbi:type I secretion C-terminal target domain-containing protein, partial [Oceanospirillaceae bacterium]|nr:type I secretion C-terminal target domain-containing protein [Oceanospirillaceae bacterium]
VATWMQSTQAAFDPSSTTVASANVDNSAASTAVTYTIVFNEALEQSSFSSADIKIINAANADITANWTIGTPTTSDGITWTVAVTPPTGANAIDLSAIRLKIDAGSITDVVGNANTELVQATSSQNFDTRPPSAPTLTLNADTGAADGITSDGVMNVGGLDANLGSWQYSVDGGSTWTTVSDGSTSFTLSAGTYAADLIRARQIDSAGLSSMITKYSSALTVDVSIDAPTLSPADGGNISASSDFVLTFAEAMSAATGKNIVIKNSSGDVTVETIAADSGQVTISGGIVTINPTDANLMTGNTYYVEVDAGAFTDVAGNESAAITGSTSWNVVVNAMSTSLEIAGDNKVSATENAAGITVTVIVAASTAVLTDLLVGDFTVTGVKDSDSSAVTFTGASYDSATGMWTATITAGGLTDAEAYTITADVTGSAGDALNLSAPQATQAVTVDTTAPTLDSTTIATDSIVNISEVTGGFSITGSTTGLETGSEVSVALNSVTYTANTLADGTWSLSVNAIDAANLADGSTHAVTVDANDAHGNPATQVSQNITVDRTAPVSTVVIDEVITNVPTMTGQTAESSVEVKLDLDADGVYGEAGEGTYTVSVSGGNWALDLANTNADDGSAPLNYSAITASSLGVQVTAMDAAGNATVKIETVEKQESSFSISDSRVIEGVEGTKAMTFIVTRSGDLSSAGTVDYAIDTTLSLAKSGGTANGVDDDYTGAANGTVSFAAGESFQEITLTVNGDYYKEVNQNIVMTLTNPTGGAVSKATGIGELSEVDASAMSGAFSLKDINPDLVSSAIRVRRSLDDQEMDIGFDKYGNLDTDALLKFVNDNDTGAAVTGAVGYVTTWYDQSSRAENMTQTSDSRQGVIVTNGALVAASNGDTTISFNQGLNGADHNDWMSMTGTGGTATNLEVYVTFEFQAASSGVLFALGQVGGSNRIGAHAPWETGETYFDVKDGSNYSRLQVPNAQTANQLEQLVFVANFNNSGTGTVAQNKVDAEHAFFVNGIVQGSKTLSSANTNLGSDWFIMSTQSGKMSEFLVYTSNTKLASPSVLEGSAINNTFTYAGEATLTSIDGKAGYDTVSLSGAPTNLDASVVALESIELIHMRNGETNQLTITDAQLETNGSILNVLMDTGDSVVYGGSTLNYDVNTQELITFGTTGNDTINLSLFNETAYGRGGDDVFVFNSWSDARSDGVVSKDTIADFTVGASSGDRLDLSDLLTYTSGDTLSNFIEVLGGSVAGGDVTLNIDKDGGNSFAAPDQVLILTGVGSSSTPITLDFLDDYNIIL